MTTDLVYLLRLGLSLEQIAHRAGRTVTAVEREIQQHIDTQREQDV